MPDFPGEFNGIQMHVHSHIDPHPCTSSSTNESSWWAWVVQMSPVELSSKALGNTLTLSTRSVCADRAYKYYGSVPADKLFAHSRTFRWRGSARSGRR